MYPKVAGPWLVMLSVIASGCAETTAPAEQSQPTGTAETTAPAEQSQSTGTAETTAPAEQSQSTGTAAGGGRNNQTQQSEGGSDDSENANGSEIPRQTAETSVGGTSSTQPNQITEQDLAAAEVAVYATLNGAASNCTTLQVIKEDTTVGHEKVPKIKATLTLELEDLESATLDSFALRNAQSTKLRGDMNLGCPYVLITAEERSELFSNYETGWDNFRLRYPGASRIRELSRVGFNQTMTQAVVYSGDEAGPLAGSGTCYLMRKVGSRWVQFDRVQLWIS